MKVPARFFLKYWHLGVAAILFPVITVLSGEVFFFIPFINNYGLLFLALSLLMVPLYFYFELPNLRMNTSYSEVYRFYGDGIYHVNHLVAEWKDIRRIDFRSGSYKKSIATSKGARNIGSGSIITVTIKIATIEIRLNDGSLLRPDLVIPTSSNRLAFTMVSNSMSAAARRVNPDVEIEKYRKAKGEDFPEGIELHAIDI